MKRAKKQKGNTLALVVVCIGVIAVLVAFFALNYGQFLGTQKRAQTAIDAAALQAARDIGRVVINNDRFGKIALCDDVPPGGDLSARPVWGLNTLLGTARLDLLIAKNLNNTTMVYLAKQDLTTIQNAGKDLADTILVGVGQAPRYGGTVQPCNDKNGDVVNLLGNAVQAYQDNSRRLGTGAMAPNSMKLTVGQLVGGTAETNIPIPLPENLAEVPPTAYMTNQSNQKVYKAYLPVDTQFGGVDTQITFAAVTDEPRLVDTSKFVELGATTNIPAIARVECDEQVTTIAPDETGQKKNAVVHVAACAQTGGPRGTLPTGVFAVMFAAGIPAQAGTPVDFTSVKTIMNSAQLPATASSSTPAPAGGWNATGFWQQIQGGPWGLSNQTGQPVNTSFEGRPAAGGDNAGSSLAFLCYDWLRSCGLRPNITSVVTALNLPLRNQPKGTATVSQNSFFMPPAYAQQTDSGDVAGAIVKQYSPESYASYPSSDPRVIQPGFGNVYVDQMAQSMGLQDIGDALAAEAPNAQRTSLNDQGVSTAVGGANLAVLQTLWDGASSQQQISQDAMANAKTVIDYADTLQTQWKAKQAELDTAIKNRDAIPDDPNSTTDDDQRAAYQAQIDQLGPEIASLKADEAKYHKRGTAVKTNAAYVGNVQVQIKGNMGAITGQPVSAVQGGLSLLNGATKFVPVTTTPTVDQIKTQATIDAGQGSSASTVGSSNDWLSDPDANGVATLKTVNKITTPFQMGRRPDGGGFIPPALAQAAIPKKGLIYVYAVMGDCSRTGQQAIGGGGVKRIVTLAKETNNAFARHNVMEGQFIFNNPGGMTSQVPGNASIDWSVNAFDWNATGATYVDASGNRKPAGNSANFHEVGFNINPPNWCHLNAFTGNNPEPGEQQCFYVSSLWNLNSPMPKVPRCSDGSTPPSRVVEDANGNAVLEVDPCPPPPRRSH